MNKAEKIVGQIRDELNKLRNKEYQSQQNIELNKEQLLFLQELLDKISPKFESGDVFNFCRVLTDCNVYGSKIDKLSDDLFVLVEKM
ncbi:MULTISPECIES: hypothetical protein [unclassified Leptospira]|uniref:hypothetical protein n=1 Tax=unclassified Leptospira TaxID=2633828 RepID=UPI00056982D7|nr:MULTISPECIES: hypothetical protein [unclassified Leptospira]MCR1795676.1 hypothetical protein [Leptospira sp. id769339]